MGYLDLEYLNLNNHPIGDLMADIIVRPAQMTDFDFVHKLRYNVGHTHAQAEPDIFIDEEIIDEQEFVREIAERIVLVAEVDGQRAGTCAATIVTTKRFSGLRSRKLCHINDIVVVEKHHRQGAGTALYENVMKVARESGCDTIQLNVWAFNEDAAAFYESLGMRCISHRFEQDVS